MTTNEAAKAAVKYMYELVEELEIPTLEAQGVDPEQVERWSKEALKDPQTVGNPRDLTKSDYEWIYNRCFNKVPSTVN